MPTARELLEQADALMRRNRARADDDIPVLTDAVPSAQEAQSRFAPRIDSESTPLVMPEVPSGIEVHGEVPLLTDAVEEIEAAALVPEVDEGEPTDWLELREGDPSVIGDAPDSIAIVPPVDLERPEPPPDFDEFDGLDEELAAAIAAAPREDESLRSTPVARILAETPTLRVAESPAAAPVVVSGVAAALLHEVVTPVAAVVTPAPPVFTLPVEPAPPVFTLPVELEPTTAPVFVRPVEPEQIATPAPAVVVDDSAHWEAMAEEIRMQVLQRIDLFTDTGLRVQLGERLQPIVDRASADLVATINLHVGELLRAYVAEAIEREIESWRKNH